MTATVSPLRDKTEKDPGFRKHFSYREFSDPSILSTIIRLPNDYLTRVANFMAPSASGQMFANKGGKAFELSREQERTLFAQFNYAKMRILQAREAGDQKMLDRYTRVAYHTRDTLINANVFLAPAVVKGIKGWQTEYQDLIAEGLQALMKAVHGFDVDLGQKFSTYAFYAIQRSMIRFMVKKQNLTAKKIEHAAESIHREDTYTDAKDGDVGETVNHTRAAIATLDDREQAIIRGRFGMNDNGGVMTLEALGGTLGLSKERVRQIEVEAKDKIRRYLSDRGFAE